jgi:choline kinase
MNYVEQNKYNNEMPVVILSAGISHKMKTREPRALLKFDDKFLIEHQFNAIFSVFPGAQITLVCGYKFEKISKKISDQQINVLENARYEQTGPAESLKLAIQNLSGQTVLFMHGDLLFNQETLAHLCYEKSFLLIDSKKQMLDKEVGVIVSNNVAQSLSYGIKSEFKWCQIAYLAEQEYDMLKFLLAKKSVQNNVCFELINQIIDMGGVFHCYEPPNMKIVEIDSIKDIKNAENLNS